MTPYTPLCAASICCGVARPWLTLLVTALNGFKASSGWEAWVNLSPISPVKGLYNFAACSNSTISLSRSHSDNLSISPSLSNAVLSSKYFSYLACFAGLPTNGLNTLLISFPESFIDIKFSSLSFSDVKFTFRPRRVAIGSCLSVCMFACVFVCMTGVGGVVSSPSSSPRAFAVNSCRPRPWSLSLCVVGSNLDRLAPATAGV
ncbi:unnamed protein product [Chrysodeixis includens]|uniref:Uncharacterized protein n=1 Tax=Chrysodeixis includens TaxID=689277 RepID=A0A9P0GW82_CHRIL|nr:unnamed protein product [Chrysodeixis includens]